MEINIFIWSPINCCIVFSLCGVCFIIYFQCQKVKFAFHQSRLHNEEHYTVEMNCKLALPFAPIKLTSLGHIIHSLQQMFADLFVSHHIYEIFPSLPLVFICSLTLASNFQLSSLTLLFVSLDVWPTLCCNISQERHLRSHQYALWDSWSLPRRRDVSGAS